MLQPPNVMSCQHIYSQGESKGIGNKHVLNQGKKNPWTKWHCLCPKREWRGEVASSIHGIYLKGKGFQMVKIRSN